MIELILLFLILVSIILSAGFFLSKLILINRYNSLEIYELGFLGIFFYTFLSTFLHLFFSLNEYLNLFIALFFFSYCFYSNFFTINNILKSKKNLLITLSFIIVIFMTIKYRPNGDYGFYHLPYIINLINEKVIFGLANIQVQFAWNSSWLNFSSMMYFPLTELKGTQLTNSILFFFILLFFFNETILNKNKINLSRYFIIFFSFYVIIKFSRVSEHGFDFPANFFLILSFYYFIKFFEQNEKEGIIKNFNLLMIFSLISITIKLSTFISPLLVFLSFLRILKKKINLKVFIRTFFLCGIFLLVWLTQQFIYSSCLVPFFEFTCLKSTIWFQNGLPEALYDATGAVNKSYREYLGDLTKKQYIEDFNWVNTWLKRNKIELLEHFAALIIPIFVLLIINLKNLELNLNKKTQLINFKFLLLLILSLGLFGLLIWFTRSPVIRFGIPYLYIILFFLIIVFLSSILNLKKINGLRLVLVLCLIFNFTKNIKRINNTSHQDSYFPSVLEVNYSNKEINNFNINYPDPIIISSQSRLCWSIPFICHIGKGENLKIEKKYNYIIIKN